MLLTIRCTCCHNIANSLGVQLIKDYLSASDFILLDLVRNWLSKIIFLYCYLLRRNKYIVHELNQKLHSCIHNKVDTLWRWAVRQWTGPCQLWLFAQKGPKAKIGQTVQKCLPPVCLAETGETLSSRRVLEVYRVLYCSGGEYFYSVCVALREATGTKSSGRWQHLLWETGGWRAPSRAPTSCLSAATLWKPPTRALKICSVRLADWTSEMPGSWKSTSQTLSDSEERGRVCLLFINL